MTTPSPIKHHPINFHPLSYNVLDAVDREDLRTPDGKVVLVQRSGMAFVIKVDGVEKLRDDRNLSASYFLNVLEVGVMGK